MADKENVIQEENTLKANSITKTELIIMSVSAAAPGLCLGGTTGTVMQGAGSALPLAFLLATFIIVLVGFSFGQLSTHYNSAGGPYAYVRGAIGPKSGFVSGWVHNGIGVCSGSIGAVFAIYLHDLVPAIPLWAGLLILMVPISLIIWRGVEMSAKVLMGVWVAQMILIIYPAIKIILLRAGVIENVWANAVHVSFTPTFGIGGLMLGVLVCVYSFVGFECPAYMGEELKGGTKEVRPTITAGIIAIGLIYVLIYILWTAVMQTGDIEAIKDSPTSVADYALLVGYYEGGVLISLATIVSCIGSYFGFASTTIRTIYDMGRTGYLPKRFAKLNKYQIPHIALIAYCSVWICTSAFGAYVSVDALFTMVALCASVTYLFICVANLKDRWQEKGVGSLIINKIIPIISILILGYMIFSSELLYIFIIAGWTLLCFIAALIWDKKRKAAAE